MALSPEQRAISQEWQIKVEALERQLEQVREISRAYLEGMLTEKECADQITLKLFS